MTGMLMCIAAWLNTLCTDAMQSVQIKAQGTLVDTSITREELWDHLVTVALQERCSFSKSIHSDLNCALLQSCVQPFREIKDGLKLEQQPSHL